MMRALRHIVFLTAAFASLAGEARAQATTPSQQSMLGLLQLATQDQTANVQASNPWEALQQAWTSSGGGPKLSTFGIQLAPYMALTSPVGVIVNSAMILFFGMAILKVMSGGERSADEMASLGLKLIFGVVFLNYPQVVYATGMIARNSGVYLMLFMDSSQSSASSPSVSGSPSNLDFEMIRVGAIRRAVQDSNQTLIGTAAGVTADIYNQLLNLTTGDANSQLQAAPITAQADALQKSRILTDNVPLLLEALSRLPNDAGTITWTARRVGKDGNVETSGNGNGGSADLTSTSGLQQLQSQTFAASEITVTSTSLVQWLQTAEQVRAQYQQSADAGQFTSIADLEKAEALAKTQYDALIYQQTTAFIHQTFWIETGFSCGRLGGALSTWQYPQGWSQADQNALSYWVDKIGLWYDGATSRVGASYSAAKPADQTNLGISRIVVKFLGKIRDAIVAKFGFWFFDVLIEAYVFVLFLAYPLWFYPKTAKAFTGALNSFIVACLAPGVASFIFILWDGFMTQVLHILTGGVLDTAYSWITKLI